MQLGPGMYTQQTAPCDECQGQGEMIDKTKRCKTCMGKKVKKENKVLKVTVDKGAPHGTKVTIHGEADQIPEAEAGDVIVQIKQKPDKIFKRKGADLFMEKEITLLEALTGIDFIFEHFDGRKIRIQNTPGDIVKPEEIKTVEGQGMPFYKKSYQFGNLFLLFKIKFPSSLEPAQISNLSQALTGQK